jgi:hypothetical protein
MGVLDESIWLVCSEVYLFLSICNGRVEEHDSFTCLVLRLGYVTKCDSS